LQTQRLKAAEIGADDASGSDAVDADVWAPFIGELLDQADDGVLARRVPSLSTSRLKRLTLK
jgi:hypothetical protein